mmetsp:Transcript_19543/g.28679  ORF Transcript_19543/g.28679 Transcript_19543/m.28679 type:complete len:109 (+) Transcript_19543:78-404(+)
MTKMSTCAVQGLSWMQGVSMPASTNDPCGMTVDRTGSVVITDRLNHALRTVSKVGAVSTLAGNRMPGHADGRGAVASFRYPTGVVLGATGDLHPPGVAGCHHCGGRSG